MPRCRPRSCRCSRTCCRRDAARGGAAGLDAVLDHADRPRRDHGGVHPRRGDRMPLFIGPSSCRRRALTVGLSRVLFPVVLLLGLNGLLVGVLQSYDQFTIPALSPAVWNVVIIVLLVLLAPHFHGERRDLRVRHRDPGGDRRAGADGVRGARPDRLPPARPHRLARPAHQAGVRADAAGDDRPRDRQPRPAHQRGLRRARLRGGAARDQQRVSHLHAAAGSVQRRGRDGPVPDAQPHGVSAATRPRCGARSATACARSTCC